MSTPYTCPEHCAEGLPRLVHAARRDGGSAQGAEHREALRVARKEIVTAFSHHIEEQARHVSAASRSGPTIRCARSGRW
jgi:hypothetical protein